MPRVFHGKLVASHDQLYTDHNTRHTLPKIVSKGGTRLGMFGRTKVMSDTWSGTADPHLSMSTNLAARGPRMIPTTRAGRASPKYHTCFILTEMSP